MKNLYIKKSLPLFAGIMSFVAIAAAIGVTVTSTNKSNTSLYSEAPTHVDTPYATLIDYEAQLEELQNVIDGKKAEIAAIESYLAQNLVPVLNVLTTTQNNALINFETALNAKNNASRILSDATTAKDDADALVTSTTTAKNLAVIDQKNADDTFQPVNLAVNIQTIKLNGANDDIARIDQKIADANIAIDNNRRLIQQLGEGVTLPASSIPTNASNDFKILVKNYNEFIEAKNSDINFYQFFSDYYSKPGFPAMEYFGSGTPFLQDLIRDAETDCLFFSIYETTEALRHTSRDWSVSAKSTNKQVILTYISARIQEWNQQIAANQVTINACKQRIDTISAERDDVKNPIRVALLAEFQSLIAYYNSLINGSYKADKRVAQIQKTDAETVLAQLNPGFIVAKSAFDKANANLTTANTNYKNATDALKTAKTNLTSAGNALSTANTNFENAEFNLATANENLEAFINGEFANLNAQLATLKTEVKTILVEQYNPLLELYESLYAQLAL